MASQPSSAALSISPLLAMTEVLTIKANTEVLGFYHKQKSEFHFQEKTDNEFLLFLLDTAVRVISIGKGRVVIQIISDFRIAANPFN